LQQFLKKENAELKQQLLQSSNKIQAMESERMKKPYLNCATNSTSNNNSNSNNNINNNNKCFWDEKSENNPDWMDLDQFVPLTDTNHMHDTTREDDTSGGYVNAFGERNLDLQVDMEN